MKSKNMASPNKANPFVKPKSHEAHYFEIAKVST